MITVSLDVLLSALLGLHSVYLMLHRLRTGLSGHHAALLR